jgi:hypothetical protein
LRRDGGLALLVGRWDQSVAGLVHGRREGDADSGEIGGRTRRHPHRRAIDVPLTDALAFQLDFRISPTGSFASSAAHPFSGDTPSALIPS